MKNQTPFVLCLIGGILLLISNYNHGAETIAVIYFFLVSLPPLTPYILLITIVMMILWFIALSGGIAVMLGGYLLTRDHVTLGKFLITISAGFGLISFILAILWVIFVAGWAGLLVYTWLILNTSWALGLVLTIIARTMAD
jgi:hypothetical protein